MARQERFVCLCAWKTCNTYSGKKSVGMPVNKQIKRIFLLGAGASKDANIPTSYEMTKLFVELESEQEHDDVDRYKDAIKFLAGGLAFQASIEGKNPFAGVDIEALFNAADLLQKREILEYAPFVSSWHQHLRTLEEPRGRELKFSVAKYHSELEQTLKPRGMKFDIDNSLTDAITSGAGRKKAETFKLVKEVMLRLLRQYVWLNPKQLGVSVVLSYFNPLLRYCKDNNCTIATLNYDNTVELAASILNLEVDNGISSWNETRKLSFSPDKIKLLKLHGSITWEMRGINSTPEKPVEHHEIVERLFEDGIFKPSLIFGYRNKLTAEGPYLSMLMELQRDLNEADEVQTFGYSYRDEHINQILIDWLNGGDKRRIVIYNGTRESSYQLPFANDLNFQNLSQRIEPTKKNARLGFENLTTSSKTRD